MIRAPKGLVLMLAGLAVISVSRTTPVSASKPQIGDLTPIQLNPGVNTVPNFSGDGRDAIIAYAWRDTGNAHGYNLILVMMPTARDKHDWNVVSVVPADSGESPQDVVSDNPHTLEDAIRSVRLARGVVDGRRSTLLIISTRAFPDTGALSDPSIVTFEIYRLQSAASPVGETHDIFKRISAWSSTNRFCNSEMALSNELGWPLSSDYEGPKTPDGCE